MAETKPPAEGKRATEACCFARGRIEQPDEDDNGDDERRLDLKAAHVRVMANAPASNAMPRIGQTPRASNQIRRATDRFQTAWRKPNTYSPLKACRGLDSARARTISFARFRLFLNLYPMNAVRRFVQPGLRFALLSHA